MATRIPLTTALLVAVATTGYAAPLFIDVTEQCAADSNYRLTAEDVVAFEERHGTIERGAIVIMRSGWGQRWPDRLSYLGDDTPGDASKLSFPSFGEGAARILVEERQVAAIGVDTASIDFGQSRDFIVHQIAAKQNVVGLENLAGLDALPPRGAVIVALPMKIEGGSGAPARVIAFIER